jgi:predicted ATPase
MNGIGFKNMKVFKERQWFDFKPITLLTGTNNSGKSSVINAMQMLQENLTSYYNNTIDNIINTEFRLKSNQNKHGNIESFVNKSGKEILNHFVFALNKNKLQYNVLVEVNDGIERFGTVKIISITDPKSKEVIFHLEIINKHPKLTCSYKVNYKYFINKFKLKCTNTLELINRLDELNNIQKLVNNEKEKPFKLYDLANEIANKYSVYINIHKVTDPEDPSFWQYDYWVYDEPLNGADEYQKIDEIGVIFKYSKEGLLNTKGLISIDEFNEKYLKFIETGVFDYDFLIGSNPGLKFDFETLIMEYYNSNLNDAYNSLSNDLLTVLSNTKWEVGEMYSEEDPLFVPANLLYTYLNCHPDFGLIASAIVIQRKKDEFGRKDFTGNFVANNYLEATKTIDLKNSEMEKLSKKDYFSKIHSKLQEIIFENYNHKDEGKNFENRSKIILEYIGGSIFTDIDKIINKINLSFNNTYVSSNRFQSKRSYNFNDNSDFTTLLNKIESLKGSNKEVCLTFINKWLKEFEIADQLILKPDLDTGDFKAFLKLNGDEILLADFGLGTNQLLPIIFSLGINYHTLDKNHVDEVLAERTVVIEEPEANLHPAMQSKLADLFVDAYKTFKVKIIAETHSEYLIRKLQFLVGSTKGNLKSQDVAIYYFYKPNHPAVLNKEVNQVEKIEIDEFGRLTKEFGSGFFDEADKISMDVFMLKFSQNN